MKIERFTLSVILFISALVILFVSSSELHSTDIRKRLLCHAIGIDYEDASYIVTAQIFKPTQPGSDTPVDITQPNVEVLTGKGKTVSEAIYDCEDQRGKKLFFGHLKLICLGKKVNLSQPEDLFAFCMVDKTVCLNTDICYADEAAKDLMETQLTTEMVSTENYIELIDYNSRKSRCGRCRLIGLLGSNNDDTFLMPVVSVVSKGGEKKEPVLFIKKTSVVCGGKISRLLDSENDTAVFLLQRDSASAELEVEINDRSRTIKLQKRGCKKSYYIEQGKLCFNVELDLVVTVDEKVNSDLVVKEIENKLKGNFYKNFQQRVESEKTEDIFELKKTLRLKEPKVYLRHQDKIGLILKNTHPQIKINCFVK